LSAPDGPLDEQHFHFFLATGYSRRSQTPLSTPLITPGGFIDRVPTDRGVLADN